MGCDYFIIKYLHVELQDSSNMNIELEQIRKYYDWDPSDTEDINFDKEWEIYTKSILSEVNQKIIYENGDWLDDEYITTIPNHISLTNIIRITEIKERKSSFEYYGIEYDGSN